MSAAVKPTKKSKPRAKRLTTLTARVTASYQLDFTDQENSVAVEALAAVKTKSRKTKKKTEGASGFKVPRTILLSPEAAVKSLDQQDLVFGTCSQLERADSPTLLKDTQIAIQESEKESLSAPTSHSNHYPRLTGPSAALTRLAAPRNLWSVAARDIEGLLVDVEVIDLVDTPEGPRFTALTHDEDRKEDTETGEVKPVKNESSISRVETLALDDASTDEKLPVAAIKPVTQPSPSKPKASTNRRMPSYENWKDTSLAREIKKNGLKAMKNRKKIVEVLKECWIAKNGLSNQGQDLKVAQDKEPTSALNQLLKVEKIKKPRVATQETSKSKSTAPQAVEAICEDSTATAISTSSTSTVSTANESQPPTSRSQEQPHIEFTLTPLVKSTPIKPEPTKSYMDIEEIQDSEDELLPSPSRLFDFFLRPEKKQELPTSPLPSSPSLKPPSTPRNDLKRQQTQEHLPTIPASVTTPSSKLKLPKLNDQITKAVRAQPRLHTSGLKRGLTWHEKILMYDPIYLEDFTAWLNTEGLSLVDEDREVGAGVVRDWCESKGICCCYKTRKPGRHY
ncbi:Slx4 endonuclease-domain-containing protein [Aspergillus crustosus]